MGIINKISKKCVFCGEKDEAEYIPAYDMYGGVYAGNWFHKGCLREVTCQPEKHSPRMVDLAIDIVDRIKEKKWIAKRREDEINEQCDYLKEHCE